MDSAWAEDTSDLLVVEIWDPGSPSRPFGGIDKRTLRGSTPRSFPASPVLTTRWPRIVWRIDSSAGRVRSVTSLGRIRIAYGHRHRPCHAEAE